MTAPDRIAVYWTAADEDTMPARLMAQTPRSPIFDEDLPKMQRVEYVRTDLADPAAIREAAIREAADSLLEASVWCDSQERTSPDWHNGVVDARKHHIARILALIQKGDTE